MKVYLASSWRNPIYYEVMATLRAQPGVEVYDFRENGFAWEQAGLKDKYNLENYLRCIKENPIAEKGFLRDMDHLNNADACVLLLPSGRSAHIEAGYAMGRGTPTAVLLNPVDFEPELMYKQADIVTYKLFDVCAWLRMLKR